MNSTRPAPLKRPFLLVLILSLALSLGFAHQGLANPRPELVGKRTLHSKTFDNGDGTVTLETHGGHIHYVDKSTDRLEECDTTLIDMGDKWIQSKASYHCEIPKYANREFVFVDMFEDKNQSIVMTPLAQPVLGEIDNSDGWVNKRVLYRNAYGKGLHLRVTAGNVGLFKEIIIDEMPKPLKDLSFDFEISLPSEKHVYVADTGRQSITRKVLLANLSLCEGQQLLMSQGPMKENAFSYIKQIRIWDSNDDAISGRLQFYRQGSKLYCRKIVPKEFLATASYPVYTDDTATYYSGTGDGWVQKRNNTDWDTTHDATTGQEADYVDTQTFFCRTGVRTGSSYYIITRGFLPFDTSALPDAASITDASLELYVTAKENGDNDGEDFVVVVQTTQPSTSSLTTADYDLCGSVNNPTEGSNRVDIDSVTVNAYNTWTLNATGRGWISKAGWTKLGVREGHDVLDHPYVGATDTKNRINGYFADNGSLGPRLSITYSVGSTTHYVDTAGSNTSPYDTEAKAAHTIQAAINACGSGTVYVRKVASAYSVFNMKSNVDVIGTDETWQPSDASDFSDHPTINVAVMGSYVGFAGPLTNCTLEGFIITSGGIYGAILVDGLSGAVTDVTINHCQVPSAPNSGVVVRGPASPTISFCDIGPGGSPGNLGSCITSTMMYYIEPTGSPIIIKGNTLHGANRTGIYFRAQSEGAFEIIIGGAGSEANQIYDNYWAGINLLNLGDDCEVTIDNNQIYNNGLAAAEDQYAGIHIANVGGGPSNDGVVIQRNTIYNNRRAGVSIELDSDVIIGAKPDQEPPWGYANEIYGNYGGIQTGGNTGTAVTGDVLIRGNYIHSNLGDSNNEGGGIWLKTPVKGTLTISQNEICQNWMGGIGIRKGTATADLFTLIIEKNSIHDHVERGGIHTGDSDGAFTSPGGFNAASAIRQNKVYNNGNASYGGGIDVRHFTGSILNNLVYGNTRGGIRFGDYVTKIRNNTVANNGGNDYGGGIVFDDPDSGAINDPADGVLYVNVGEGDPGAEIRNNISTYNETAGVRVGGNGYDCPENPDYPGDPTGDKYRDFNLLYLNNGTTYDCNWEATSPDRRCVNKNYGGCGLDGWTKVNPNDIIADPLFADMASDDYTLQSGSPAEGAGDDGNDLGAYGGIDPLDDAEIPDFSE